MDFKGFLDDHMSSEKELKVLDQLILLADWPLAELADHQGFEIAFWLAKQSEFSFAKTLSYLRSASHRRLLGNRDGRLVAYKESDEYLRQCNLERRLPTGVRPGEWYVWASEKWLLDAFIY